MKETVKHSGLGELSLVLTYKSPGRPKLSLRRKIPVDLGAKETAQRVSLMLREIWVAFTTKVL